MAMLRIYYLGGMGIPKDTEKNFKITSGQEVFTCPPVGEWLEVADYIGRDIMKKYGDNVFTPNAELARQVAAGNVSFEKSQVQGKTVIKEILSDDEYIAKAEAIKERRAQEAAEAEEKESELKPDDLGYGSEEDNPEVEVDDEVEEEPKKPSSRRTRKQKVKE